VSAADDLPSPDEPFTIDHLDRWPMGVVKRELIDGEAVFQGLFDDRDAAVARRAFPGRRVVVDDETLTVAHVVREELRNEQWTDDDEVEHHHLGSLRLFRRPGQQNWTQEPSTQEEQRRNREQLAADEAQAWDKTVAAYAADPDDLVGCWRYLADHPIFWSWMIPTGSLADLAASDVDEATWARIESEAQLLPGQGMDSAETYVSRGDDGTPLVTIEHGPMLWPLDVAAEHRFGLHIGGQPSLDIQLTSTAPTWEEAVVALAASVRERYGDDRARIPDQGW
jgi:hypothetical protein